jgi:uncharacterized protein YjcR
MSEEIDRWIVYMKNNPDTWKSTHTQFINAQFAKSDAFIQRLLQEPDGKEKVIQAYGIKNVKGYEKLLQ